jgi:hypothetical protein
MGIAKEYKVAPRWKRYIDCSKLVNARGEVIAEISWQGEWEVKTRNRSGGWLYAYAASLAAAKRKAAKMIREEAK